MTHPTPSILIVCDDPSAREAVADTVADIATVRLAASAAEARAALQDQTPDIVIAVLPLAGEDALSSLLAAAARPQPAPAILTAIYAPGGEPRAVRLLSGPEQPLRNLVTKTLETRAEPADDELTLVLRAVAKARHDINNPLTSALAETQLLLMEPHEPALRESLEVIESQLRRIRDLVSSSLRFPRPAE
ncbi:MAG: hypothetical protein HY704_13745 [Gemmatimonadetes bacterium]|nr:hypothetical protein [Gemmatimonadota bacterium]